jgi:hypothetical protein
MFDRLEAETHSVMRQIAPGPRLVIIGSTSFWGPDSARICDAIAADLAELEDLVAVTGGMDGVGLSFGRAFSAARKAMAKPEKLYHLLPAGFGPCDSGVTIDAGNDFFERREVLGRLGQIYLMIEGGPGTEHEAQVAVSKGFPVIPVGRTGGHAKAFHQREIRPGEIRPDLWRTLGDAEAPLKDVVAAVRTIVRESLFDRLTPS